VQWGLGGGHVKMDSRRMEALSGAMAASMADLARAMRISALEMDHWLVTASEART
jgi:hypothetical protein